MFRNIYSPRTIKNIIFLPIKYIQTMFNILLHPTHFFRNLFSKKKLPPRINSFSFLLANIVLASWFGKLLGFKIPGFPFDAPKLFLKFCDISYPVFRIIFGITLFLMILGWVFRKNKINILSHKIVSIICYASATFIPSMLIKLFNNIAISNFFKRLVSSSHSGGIDDGPLTTGLSIGEVIISRNYAKLDISDFFTVLVILIINLAFISWWISLVYKGLKISNVIRTHKLIRGIISSYCLFFLLQMVFMALNCMPIAISTARIFRTGKDIRSALSQPSPNYAMAVALMDNISRIQGMSLHARYMAKIHKVVYGLATISASKIEKLIGKDDFNNFKEINYKEINYPRIQRILHSHLKKLAANKKNPKRTFCFLLIRDIEEANRYRNSPEYIEGKTEIYFGSEFHPSIIALLP